MESRLGHDFASVRVHADGAAAESTKAVSARAYTVGHHVVFGSGEYVPQQPEGRRLLVHELVHVVQQSRGSSAGNPRFETQTDVATDPSERLASMISTNLCRRGAAETAGVLPDRARMFGSAALGLQREPVPGPTGLALRPSPLSARIMGSLRIDRFALNSDALTSTHRRLLSSLASTILQLLRGYPMGTVVITGHTDATGDETTNVRLGLERAEAARKVLVSGGVPDEVLLTETAGESRLLVPTASPEPRNRRVEINFRPESPARFPLSLELASPSPGPAERPRLLPPELPMREETPEERVERILTTPPPSPRPRRTLNEIVRRKVDEGIDSTMSRLGIRDSGARRLIREAARRAIESGAQEILDRTMNQLRLGPEAQEAIRAALRRAGEIEVPSE